MPINYKNLWMVFTTLLITLGVFATAYGFSTLLMPDIQISTWRWTHVYLFLFIGLFLLIALVGRWLGAIRAGILVSAVLLVALGAVFPLIVVCLLALSLFALGNSVFHNQPIAKTDAILVGVVILGSVFSLLVHFPVNNAGTWGVLLALPLVAGWHHVRALLSDFSLKQNQIETQQYLVYCAIGAAIPLHLMVALMPEIGHDALAFHLFVPAYVSYQQKWGFDASNYVWAVMPMLVDWLYAIGFLFAGETCARLINVGGLILLAVMIQRLSIWAGATRVGAGWGILLFLTTPLTYLESSSLFIEAWWSALAVGGSFALLRLLITQTAHKTEILLAAITLGGAIAAKAVSFTILPVILLVVVAGFRRWFSMNLLPIILIGILLCLAIGMIPYTRAYILTGNPLFPFFNAFFQSPLYPSENFSPPAVFDKGLAWDSFFRMTFVSGNFLEATQGAAGFQWLLVVIPAAFSLALLRQRRALVIAFVGFAWLWLVFLQTAYLRYIFPTFAFSCVLVAVFLSVAEFSERWVWRGVVIVVVVTLTLNLLHFHSATNYGRIEPKAIVDLKLRDSYLDSNAPLRSAVKLVNELNRGLSPVAFFSAPLAAGLNTDALYANWYNPKFYDAIARAAGSADAVGRVLAQEGVDYIVSDSDWQNKEILFALSGISTEMAKIGSVSIRKLDERFRFSSELLSSTKFGADWHLTSEATQLSDGGLRVSVTSPAYSVVPVRQGRQYQYVAQARCAQVVAKGRLQVNWLGKDGKMVGTNIDVFDCSPLLTNYYMDVKAPAGAEHALVYASGHEANPVVFTEVSFKN